MKEDQFLQIEQLPGFVKDTKSGAILNTDRKGREAYKRQKLLMQSAQKDRERIEALESKLDNIEALLLRLVGNK
jgi:hypothetical protein